jgi:hypothetical protein
MSKKNSRPIRADARFIRELNDMRLKRQLRFPKEKLKPKSQKRITLAMTRHKLFPKIKKDIIDSALP